MKKRRSKTVRSGQQLPATIKDVATQLGMSVATVSRALSQPQLLKAETRERVMSVVKQLGYAPNPLARGLRRGQTRALLVVVPTLSPFFLEIFAGAEEVARAQDFAVLLGHSNREREREQAYFDQVASGGADGIILLTGLAPEEYASGQRPLPPLVSVLERLQGTNSPVIRVDHRVGAKAATQHLIELGHRRIAHILGARNAPSSMQRWGGYRDALNDAGIGYAEELVVPGDFSIESGVTAMERLLALADPPTAVFAGNDEMAFGAMTAARGHGLSVPQDLSVVGFDDQRTAAFYNPPLTTVHIPRQDLGRQATQELIDRLAGRDIANEIVLPIKLVQRESTAPPPRTRRKTSGARSKS